MTQTTAQPAASTAPAAGFLGVDWARIDRVLLIGLIVVFAVMDMKLLQIGLSVQPAGIDLLPLWTGGRIDPHRLYDFAFVTNQQAWLFAGKVRPFVYPPSSLLLFRPLALLPFWQAYAVVVAATATLFLWLAGKLGADRRLLIATPAFVLVVFTGQVTFLIGALVMAALMQRGRPILSGVLFGLAGMIKPQMLVLLPFALMIEGNWRAFWATGATAAACGLVSLLFGASWSEWAQALPRFTALVEHDPTLVRTMLTPYARWGHSSLLFSVPIALAGVWFAFRRGDPAQKLLALLGGALLVSPYAMKYEIALIIPAVLALRKPLVWGLPFWLSLICWSFSPVPLLAAMALLFASFWQEMAEMARRLLPRALRVQEA